MGNTSHSPDGPLLPCVIAGLQTVLGVDDETVIDPDRSFAEIGLTSIGAVTLARKISDAGVDVPVSAVFGYPTPRLLANAITSGELTEPANVRTRAVPDDEPVAVVSMALRLPGADDPDEFWSLLCAAEPQMRPPSPGRFPLDAPQLTAGYLDRSFEYVDPVLFGLPPREVEDLDPVQALALEVVWEALTGTCRPREDRVTGVFMASIWAERVAGTRPGHTTAFSATGASPTMVANRVSYTFDLRGPSLTVDSACSSSLVGAHLAARSLRQGECDVAVFGGVNLLQSADTMADLVAFGGLAPDGRSKPFVADADGFGRGEGACAIVLKRLSTALADGDRVQALLHGTATNNDGRTNGLTAPSPLAQQRVILRAHQAGGTDPGAVAYVETHGTGTALGDPIEASGIAAAHGSAGRARGSLSLGTLKGITGHLEGASGAAGFTKAALAIAHGRVPPNARVEPVNPQIDLAGLGLSLPGQSTNLDAGALAGISSFGWGGTNAHVVIGPARTGRVDNLDLADPDRVGFIFSPYGGQFPGMARDLLGEPAFRRAVEECDAGIEPVLGRRVLDVLAEGVDVGALGVAVGQPAVYALQVGLAAVLADRGVRPAVVVGHSLGEISAAVVAEAITPREGGRLVVHYAAAQQKLSRQGGGMAIIECDRATLDEILDRSDTVALAGINSAFSFNVAGPVPALDELVGAATRNGLRASRIDVAVAAHSSAIEAVAPGLRAAAGELDALPPYLPMVSTVTGRPIDRTVATDHFVDGLLRPVQLATALSDAHVGACTDIVEINAHGVLQDALATNRPDTRIHSVYGRDAAAFPPRSTEKASSRALITLSTHTTGTLAARSERVAEWWPSGCGASDVAATTASMPSLSKRGFAVAATADELRSNWREVIAEYHDGGLLLVFPGQGGQWEGMGRKLFEASSVFRHHVRRCDQALRDTSGCRVMPWFEPAARDVGDIERVDHVQPALFTYQVALARTLMEIGARPSAVVGHSMGELAAAHIAGWLSLDDAAAVIGRRSQLMQQLAGQGGMLVVEATSDVVEDLVREHSDAAIAAYNSPRSTVLAGPEAVLHDVAAKLDTRDVFNRYVQVPVASHCALMDPILPELRERIADVEIDVGQVAWYSGVLGRSVEGDDPALTPAYWVDNLRQPVRFLHAVRGALTSHPLVVEISPHPVLAQNVRDIAADSEVPVDVLSLMRRDENDHEGLLTLVGEMYARGVPVDTVAVNRPGQRQAPPLPFPYERTARSIRRQGPVPGAGFPGRRVELPGERGKAVWVGELTVNTAHATDHVVHERPVLPVAALVRAAMDIGDSPPDALTLADVTAEEPIEPDDAPHEMLILEHSDGHGRCDLRYYWNGAEAPAATVTIGAAEAPLELDSGVGESAVASAEDVLTWFRERGLSFGPEYRRLHNVRIGETTAAADLVLRPAETAASPAVMDAAMQCAVLALRERISPGRTPVTAGIRTVWIAGSAGSGPVSVRSRIHGAEDEWVADADLVSDGRVVVAIRGMRVVAIPNTTAGANAGEGPVTALTSAGVQELVASAVARVMGTTAASIDPTTTFRDMGISSALGMELTARLEREAGLPLRATLLWNHPTVEALSHRLTEMLGLTEPPSAPGGEESTDGRPTYAEPTPDPSTTVEASERELIDELAELESLLGDL